MKKVLLGVLLSAVTSIAAAQTVIDTNNNTTTNNTNNSTTVNTNTNVNTSTNTSTNYNNDTSTSHNVNVNDSTSKSDSTVTSKNDNRNYNESVSTQRVEQTLNQPPPSAIAPTVMSYSQDVCTSGVSGAVQTQILGLSAGKSVRDENCEMLKISKTLYDMGMKVAAVSMMCQDDRVFKAMQMAGTPCPYMGKIGKEASDAWEENKPKKKPFYSRQQ